MRRKPSYLLHAAIAPLLFAAGSQLSRAAPVEKSEPAASPLPRHRPVKADKLRGPFERTATICATLRKAACQRSLDRSWGSETEKMPTPSTCVPLEVNVQGALGPPFLEVQGLRATCGETGATDGEVRLLFRTADGWYLGPQQPVEYEDRKVTEQVILQDVRTEEIDGTRLLMSKVRHRCTLDPAKIEGYDELTTDAERLVVIGIGSSGKPSALTYELGSTQKLLLRPIIEDDEPARHAKKQRAAQTPRLAIDESIDIGWHVRPGTVLELDEPVGNQRIKPAHALPFDIPCTDSVSFSRRLKQARKLAGMYPMKFQ